MQEPQLSRRQRPALALGRGGVGRKPGVLEPAAEQLCVLNPGRVAAGEGSRFRASGISSRRISVRAIAQSVSAS